MPNHCENDLYISGPAGVVAEALAFVGADLTPPKFDFNALIPYPEPWATMDAEHRAIEEAGKAAGLAAIGGAWPDYDRPEFMAARAAYWQAERAAMAPLMDAYEAKWGTRSDGYNQGGHEWCVREWGTKWGAYDVARRDYEGRVIVTFQTAWSPGTKAVIALAKRFPRCTYTLEYFEQGMSYAGGFTIYAEDDWYDDEPWESGKVIREWRTDDYQGRRGG